MTRQFSLEEGWILGMAHEGREMRDWRWKLGENDECTWLNLCPLPAGVLEFGMSIVRYITIEGQTLSPPFLVFDLLQNMGDFMR
jgi:hypothetical protein